WPLGLFALTGCLHPVAEKTDETVSLLASRPPDVAPSHQEEPVAPMPAAAIDPGLVRVGLTTQEAGTAQEPTLPQPRRLPQRLIVPPELPGAGAPRVTLPPTTAPPKEREAAINKLFPSLPPLG